MGDGTLIIGATGLLGSIVYKKYQISHEVYGTYYKSPQNNDKNLFYLDASDFTELSKLVEKVSPIRIINCMGLTSVEQCEMRPEANWKLNAEVPMRLAEISKSKGIQLTHISTDHYESIEREPRTEASVVHPINQYGFAKFQAEKLVYEYNPEALILRTNFFGHARSKSNSLLDFALHALGSNQKVIGFTDVFFSPVGDTEIANFLLDERSSSVKGLLNFSSKEVISKFEFLGLVARILGLHQPNIDGGSITNSELLVARPNYLALDSARLEQEVNYKMPALKEMLKVEMNSHA